MLASRWVRPSPDPPSFCAQSLSRSAAVMTLGAATLADIFDPHERGRKVCQDPSHLELILTISDGNILHCTSTRSFPRPNPRWSTHNRFRLASPVLVPCYSGRLGLHWLHDLLQRNLPQRTKLDISKHRQAKTQSARQGDVKEGFYQHCNNPE